MSDWLIENFIEQQLKNTTKPKGLFQLWPFLDGKGETAQDLNMENEQHMDYVEENNV